jgi:hypothetical protein
MKVMMFGHTPGPSGTPGGRFVELDEADSVAAPSDVTWDAPLSSHRSGLNSRASGPQTQVATWSCSMGT